MVGLPHVLPCPVLRCNWGWYVTLPQMHAWMIAIVCLCTGLQLAANALLCLLHCLVYM